MDMVWSKVAAKERSLSYDGFLLLLSDTASRKNMTEEEIHAYVLSHAKVTALHTSSSGIS